MRDTVTIYVPEGYKNPRESLDDCGVESLSVGPENVAAFNDGYAAGLEDRDEKLPRSAASTATPNPVVADNATTEAIGARIGDILPGISDPTSLQKAQTSPEPDAVRERDIIAAIIEPEAMAEYEAGFAKKPGGPTYTMMANYPQVKAARDKADAILAALARNDRARPQPITDGAEK